VVCLEVNLHSVQLVVQRQMILLKILQIGIMHGV
jgi:hypothetical protein